MQSLIKTKHKAVVINTSKVPPVNPYAPRMKVCVRQYSPTVAKRLSEYACRYNCSGITNDIDNNSDNIDDIYDDFVKILKSTIDAIVPSHYINMRSSDPPYISPAIKLRLH